MRWHKFLAKSFAWSCQEFRYAKLRALGILAESNYPMSSGSVRLEIINLSHLHLYTLVLTVF